MKRFNTEEQISNSPIFENYINVNARHELVFFLYVKAILSAGEMAY